MARRVQAQQAACTAWLLLALVAPRVQAESLPVSGEPTAAKVEAELQARAPAEGGSPVQAQVLVSHVRDKRLLPDPTPADMESQAARNRGYIAPAAPMGFSKEKRPLMVTPLPPAAADSKGSSARTYQKRTRYATPDTHRPDPQIKTIESFLDQTRKLGVPDQYALELLDKELAKVTKGSGGGGPGSGVHKHRPVYLASPLKPYGALLNFNQKPYEKHQLKSSKPIKEQQNDIPPPKKPLVVESEMKHLAGQITEAVVVPSKPLPVAVPMQMDPLHLLQTSQVHLPAATTQETASHTLATISHQAVPLEPGVGSYQLASAEQVVTLPHPSYATLTHEQLLQVMPQLEEHQVIPSQAGHQQILHSYPVEISHQAIASQELQQLSGPGPSPAPVSAAVTHQEPQQQVHAVVQEVEYVYPVAAPNPVAAQDHAETTEGHPHQAHHSLYGDHHEYAAQYRFGYRVRDDHSASDFGHSETREGKMTKGEYFVSLPDGRLQSVRYWADPSGYHAHVTYSSHAAHVLPAPKHHHVQA